MSTNSLRFRKRFDAALGGIRWRGDKGSGLCPFHNDHRPSLFIDGKRGLFFCHGCRAKGNVQQFERRVTVGALSARERPESEMDKKKFKTWLQHKIVKHYIYLDKEGEPLFEKIRFEPKSFAFKAFSKNGKWEWGLQDCRTVIYNLPAVLKSKRIFVVEGEKDSNNLIKLGLTATCNPEGAGPGKWKERYSKSLAGKTVFVLQDADEIGQSHAKEVARSVACYAAEVRLIPPFPVGKDVSDWLARGGTKAKLLKLATNAPVITKSVASAEKTENLPEPSSPDVPLLSGPKLVRKLELFLERRVILPPGLALAIALWVIGTYLTDAFDCFPYVCITSPTKRCGKTLLAELIGFVARRSKTTVNISEAALFRMIEAFRPTIILDEAESLADKRSERAKFLLSLLNAGHRKNANVIRCVGPDHTPTEFPVYCPKVLLAIGNLPDTFRDRSIIVSMRRRRKDETVDRYRYKEVSEKGQRRALLTQAWVEAHQKEIEEQYANQVLEFLDGREADNWASIFAVAAVAVPDRFEELKQIAIKLGNAKNALDLDDSEAIRLLSDIRNVFSSEQLKATSTSRLLSKLKSFDESPWEDLTPIKLARMLRPFNVSSRQVWTGNRNVRGYLHDDLKPVFASYLSQ